MGLDELKERFNTNKEERKQHVFMSHDDVPNEFLDKLEDGLTSDEIQEELDEHDLPDNDPNEAIADLESLGYDVSVERESGSTKYFVENLDPEFSNVDTKRVGSSSKQTTTRKANDYLEKKEREIEGFRQEIEDKLGDYPRPDYGGDVTQILHVSDVHFGDEITDERGNVIYDSDSAHGAVATIASEGIRHKKEKEDAGYTVDGAVILLGGDMVTNESIYDHQPHDIDSTVDEQIDRATAALSDMIEMYSNEYDHVKVVCQHGNHGEFRVDGSSPGANADDLLYNFLEMYFTRREEANNVQFVQSNTTDYTNFEVRGHKGHLRHGDNVLQHIGTSAGKKRWYAHLQDNGFDVAFRGHFHEHKEEPIHGVPVYEAPSPAPGDDFSKKVGEHSDESLAAYTLFADDHRPDASKEKIYK